MRKSYLLTPGPSPVPPGTLLKMAEPMIHHRKEEFREILAEVREGLKYLFQTRNEVLILSSSGTGAMEGAVSNTLSKGDRALVINGGKFGERWVEICEAYGVEVDTIDVPWGEAVEANTVREFIDDNRSVKAVFVQACETSTGVYHPVQAIAEITRDKSDTIIVVDAISALGAIDIPMDKWGLDVVVTGSQKALMLPPGLAFACLSDKAWKFVERSDLPKYYFNFKKEFKSISKNQTAYTSGVSLIKGLRESLKMIKKEELQHLFAKYERLAKATRAAIVALGLQLYAPKAPSNAVTAVLSPEGVDGIDLVNHMREKHGIIIAGGQGRAKGKIFRVAHMGYADKFDMIMVISALEMTLNTLGYEVEPGKGVKAAMSLLSL